MRSEYASPRERRNILVAVAGQTPAVITETLWALEHERGLRVDEIRVITTARGRDIILRDLLGKSGVFARYCEDYRVPHGRIAFSPKQVHVLTDANGRDLEDIRDSQDNTAAADQIFSLIREWTGREEEILFCSAAGGRKTMGIYLAMSLMLCGRREDTLSHVLVNPEFEAGVRDFYYPPPEPRTFRKLVVNGSGAALHQEVSSEEAHIDLAEIPFLRLREALGGELPLEKGLVEAVRRSQLLLAYLQDPPVLRLHLATGKVELGEFSFTLTRQLTAVYAFFLREFNGPPSGGTMEELCDRRLVLAETERRIDRLRLGERDTYAWETEEDIDDFRARISPCISKVNHAVTGALGNNRLAAKYRISTGGRYGVDIKRVEILDSAGKPRRRSRR
jgi:CRISPR-associated protein (TIGR02584 family)